MLPQFTNISGNQLKLLKILEQLSDEDRETLLAFAEFLAQREAKPQVQDETEAAEPGEPIDIPRPEEETVVAAIKRLSTSYHMLDRSVLLNKTSSLMTAHLIHGRAASEVIDELEEMFSQHYDEHLEDNGKE